MTFENAGSSEMGRCVLSFGIILAIFYLVGNLPSENDWLLSLRKWFLVASGAFLIFEEQSVSSPGAVSLKRYSTSSSSESVNS